MCIEWKRFMTIKETVKNRKGRKMVESRWKGKDNAKEWLYTSKIVCMDPNNIK